MTTDHNPARVVDGDDGEGGEEVQKMIRCWDHCGGQKTWQVDRIPQARRKTLQRPWALLSGSGCLYDRAGCDRSIPEAPTGQALTEIDACGNGKEAMTTFHGDRGPSGSAGDPIQPGGSGDDRSFHDHRCSCGCGCGCDGA